MTDKTSENSSNENKEVTEVNNEEKVKTQNNFLKFLKRFWHFLWKEESLLSYVVFIILSYIVLKFAVFPLFLMITGFSDIAAVVSDSMHHSSLTGHTFNDWLDFYNFSSDSVKKWPCLEGINRGDVIIVKSFEPDQIKVGDIILFYHDKRQIVHRVVFINQTEGEYSYTTKGDANPVSLDFEKNIPYSQIKGKLITKIPFLGYPRLILMYITPMSFW